MSYRLLDAGDKPYEVIKSDKHESKFAIMGGLNGRGLFHVEMDGPGVLPKVLSQGRWMALADAIKAVRDYIRMTPVATKAVRNTKIAEYHKENGIKLKTKPKRKVAA